MIRSVKPTRLEEETAGIASLQHHMLKPLEHTKIADTVHTTSSILSPLSPTSAYKVQNTSSLPNEIPSRLLNSNTTTLSQSPLYFRSIDMLSKNVELSHTSSHEPSIEQHFHKVMMIMFQESKDLLILQKKLIEGEKEWKDHIYSKLQDNESSLHTTHAVRGVTSSITKFLGPLGLIATGAVTIATGGLSIFAAGALALGGLLLTDTLLDDAAKKTVAGWLSQANGESQEAWLGRIHLFSSVLSVAASFGLAPHQAITIATNVSNVALSAVRTGADIRENAVKALLTEIEQELKQSESMTERHIDALTRISETMKEFTKALSQVYASLRATGSMIHG